MIRSGLVSSLVMGLALFGAAPEANANAMFRGTLNYILILPASKAGTLSLGSFTYEPGSEYVDPAGLGTASAGGGHGVPACDYRFSRSCFPFPANAKAVGGMEIFGKVSPGQSVTALATGTLSGTVTNLTNEDITRYLILRLGGSIRAAANCSKSDDTSTISYSISITGNAAPASNEATAHCSDPAKSLPSSIKSIIDLPPGDSIITVSTSLSGSATSTRVDKVPEPNSGIMLPTGLLGTGLFGYGAARRGSAARPANT